MTIKVKRIYHRILMALTLFLVGGIFYYIKSNPTFFRELKNLNPLYLLPLFFIHAIGILFLGLTHKLPLKKHDIDIKTREWYGLCAVSEMFNMILPANGGTGIRMMYLKDKKNLPIRQFLAMNFAMIVTGFTMLGIVGSLYFEYIYVKQDTVFQLLHSIFTALALSGIFLLIFSEILGKVFKIKRKYSPKVYLFDSRLTFTATLYWFVFFALYPLKIYLSFLSVGTSIGLTGSFEISLLLIIATFFQVLPGNIGVKEMVTAYISSHYGINFETALLASLIDRGVLLLFILPVGIYFYWDLFLDSITPTFAFSFKQERSEQTSP